MKPEKILEWVEFYGSATASAALALCTKGDARTAQRLAEDAVIALDQIRAALKEMAEPKPANTTPPGGDLLTKMIDDLYRNITYPITQPRGIFSALGTGRHQCAICGKAGPILHEGNTYICASCNATLDAAKQQKEGKAAIDEQPAEPATDDEQCGATHRRAGTWGSWTCELPASHTGPHHADGLQWWAAKHSGQADKPTRWCGNPDHDDPCDNCETALVDAAEALRERMPDDEPDQPSSRYVNAEAERAHYAALGAQMARGERP